MTDSLLDAVLRRAVQIATGRLDAAPRPGQVDLARRIASAMESGDGQVVAAAPTGSGKSMAYLVPAALASAGAGERTVVSTESLSLQAQIVDKDLPVVTRAVAEITGEEVTFAVLKGWQNYACALEAVDAARVAAGMDTDAPVPITADGLNKLADEVEKSAVPSGASVPGKDGAKVAAAELAEVAVWALRATADGRTGDRHSYPDAVSDAAWNAVSVSASDCVGKACPLFELCRPRIARQRAADADIVVTNHSLLGIQAAKGVPVVLSSRSLGQFDHIVVDEAHSLPGVVRDQGASVISGRRIGALRASIARTVDTWAAGGKTRLAKSNSAADLEARRKDLLAQVAVGTHVAAAVDTDLARFSAKFDASGVARLGEGDSPLPDSGDVVVRWIGEMRRIMRDLVPLGHDLTVSRNKARIATRLDNLLAAVKDVTTHQVGTARWVELRTSDGTPEVKCTPVDVAGAIAGNLWTTDVILAVDGEDDRPPDDEPSTGLPGKDRLPLSVTAVSATLPRGFTREVGMSTKLVRYPSPLADAYASSVLFIPKPDDGDLAALTRDSRAKRMRLDTKLHADWAAQLILRLVDANRGSALVLAATSASGRQYAELLRLHARSRWNVLSQWDGRLASTVAADWRSEETSVLVGTRSYMTGLDAPGSTCTLVVVDRPPRAAGNPVDDARVEMLCAGAEISKWEADRKVYVADATVLLEQAVGRLLRSTADRGMVAVLDPRLLRNGPFSYQEQTRAAYMSAVKSFGTKYSGTEKALGWLRSHAAARDLVGQRKAS